MKTKKGTLSIHSENIFPIIKKWMYSDQDIFIREMVSNASDALTKLKKLGMAGEYVFPEDYKPSIRVMVDDKAKTLKFIDNGLGMTADEVEEYITQIAFSGATDFLEKYKDKADADQIIGHFGLGFYSAFMVADEVQIDTLSYKEGAEAVHWACDGSTDYIMEAGKRTEAGTTITLFLNDNCYEFSNEYRVREVLEKYCSFIPYEIYLSKENAEPQYQTIDEEELLDTDTVVERIHEDAVTEEKTSETGEKYLSEITPAKDLVKIIKRNPPVNDTNPLWLKHPNECSEEEYKAFYFKVFRDYKEPLFWIHLNMDYPFNLKGILYFPRLVNEFESAEGVIKLYNNQVFIADNIKEVIPEYLLLLKGVIDCPDLPLNVSRSALQNDGFVNKISDYISKKVADKLTGMFKTDRESFEKYWDDIQPFVKYGCLKDKKFSDKMMDCVLYKDIDGKYHTLKELVPELENEKDDENAQEEIGGMYDKKGKHVISYVTDPIRQGQYINLFRKMGKNAVILEFGIDAPFITHIEQRNSKVFFQRVDSDINDEIREGGDDLAEASEKLQSLFRKHMKNEKMEVVAENINNDKLAAVITVSEAERRMQDMMEMYATGDMDKSMFMPDPKLILNHNHPLIKYLEEHEEDDRTELVCRQIYDLAFIQNQPLSVEAMSEFIDRSNRILLESLK